MKSLDETALAVLRLYADGQGEAGIVRSLGISKLDLKPYSMLIRLHIESQPDLETAAEGLGFGVATIENFLKDISQSGRLRAKKKNEPEEKQIEQIKQAMKYGSDTYREIKKTTGIQYRKLRKLNIRHKLGIMTITEKRKTAIKKALNDGVDTLEELCERADTTPTRLLDFSKEHGMEIPYDRLAPYGNWTEVDKQIGKGLDQTAIGESVHKSAALIQLYIQATNQHSRWKAAKKQKRAKSLEELTQARDYLLGIFNAAVDKDAAKEGWATQKAVEWIRSHKCYRKARVPVNLVFKILQRYETAERQNYRLSLLELGEDTNLNKYQIGRILKEVGLEPLYGSLDRKVTPKWKKEAIDRAYGTEMSSTDIGYFLALPKYIPYQRFAAKGRDRTQFAHTNGKFRGSIKLASQIYEAEDFEFSKEDIAFLLDINPETVRRYLKKRPDNEPRIIAALRTMLPGSVIEKPYLK